MMQIHACLRDIKTTPCFIGIVIGLVFCLSACQQEDKTSGSVMIEPEASKSIYFDGTEFIRPDVPNLAAPYTIDVVLKSGSSDVGTQMTETTPPMPFMAGDFAMYQMGGEYKIATNGKNVAECDGVMEFKQIRLTADGYGGGQIMCAGLVVWSGKVGKSRRLIIGKGFKDRYWQGTMTEFKIFSPSSDGENIQHAKPVFDILSKRD